ncbi:arsenate reductase ArsC [Aestuariibacter sp. A3R04]|uniref:arsenate reductase ArsC n=1 Tax=Aestuariibacter sp. A3R04 TaxID=2841571 RepID=UPI001C090020|nr:arsenate reductase ArsC [Aestuariibacter sp. A3R04]MBU3023343.1 arsenate reductase ArsC [Aestuariibacter sp. A3R04]
MKILFICTHNRCRSILSEAITNSVADGIIEARSAGSQPSGQVHPLSVKYLREQGYNTDGLKSQSWDEFEDFDADVVITVCDSAAGEACPVWFGKSIKVHWGLEDPSKVEGTESEIKKAFLNTIDIIRSRAVKMVEIAQQSPDADALKKALNALGAQ